jgi:hypothetical protein
MHRALFSLCFLLLALTGVAAPLHVQLTSPTNRSVLPTGNLQITVTTTPTNVYAVNYYTNGIYLGRSHTWPYSYTWSNPPVGYHEIQAVMQSLDFVNAHSERVHVQVGEPGPPTIIRAYLQTSTQTGVVVRWRTSWFTPSVLRLGTNAGSLTNVMNDSATKRDHEARVTGLLPDTRYFYSVGDGNALVLDSEFRTAPQTPRPFRVWVIGDSGTANAAAANVRDAYERRRLQTDVWLMLGDNAYGAGTEREYQRAVFDMYPQMLARVPVWPAIGNHDALGPYDEFFTLPTQGEAGGLPSGTELYYSFDFANAHFVCLDSCVSSRQPGSPMLRWLEEDLAATDKDWIIAYWHHPPYTRGTYDSDYEGEMYEIRQFILPILEANGVDLVLSGHSHVYERSFLLNGHYGISVDLESGMILDGGLGRVASGGYRKPAGGMGAGQGTVYAVCGCSGQGGIGEFDLHPAMAVKYGGFGSMILEFDGLRLDASFIDDEGTLFDGFRIDKSQDVTNAPPLHVTRAGTNAVVSWPTSKPQFLLQRAPTVPTNDWMDVTRLVSTNGRRSVVEQPMLAPREFFRLRRSP